MNKRQKEVIQHELDAEKEVLEKLTQQYQRALNDIDRKIRILESDELTQSRIYRIEHQKVLRKQVSAVLEKLHADEYTTIQQFLSDSYTDAFVGTAYDMFGQGVPLILPIDKNAAVKAVTTDSKISEGLYESLGVDTKKLKSTISAEITRGLASGLAHSEIARNIANTAKAPLSRAKTIVRTESHRIQQASKHDAQKAAVQKGANVVKQWNSTLDGDTRPTHKRLDGKLAEVDEFFEMDGKQARYPGDFGDPAEDCNCRCQLLQRARIALDEDELKTLQERAKFFGLDKTDDFDEFKSKYLEASKMAADESAINWGEKGIPITTEEYKECMEYARSKGIELAGFKKFEGKVETVKAMVDDAKAVADLYPAISSDEKRKLTIKLSPYLDSRDFAVAEGRIIRVNADAFRNTELLEKEYQKLVDMGWFVKGTDHHAIIKHEMGHVVADIYGIDVLAVAEAVTGMKGSAEILEYCESHLSEYSAKFADCSEIISECFASVYNSKEKNDFALKFVEICDRIIVG